MNKPLIHTHEIADWKIPPRKVPAKNLARAGLALGAGFAFLPFVKIKHPLKAPKKERVVKGSPLNNNQGGFNKI